MGHNLMHNTMAYVGEPPWHSLGKRVPENVSAEMMIKAANLDWKVIKEPALGASKDFNGKYSRYVIKREAREQETDDVMLGMVGKSYEPVQNTEAFKFFEPFIKTGFASYQTAGALGDGEKVWVLAKLNGHMKVSAGDLIEKFMLLSNSHDGKGAVSVRFTPIRVVCQNTLNLAAEGGRSVVKIRHTRWVSKNIEKAQTEKLHEIIEATFQSALTLFQDLAQVHLTQEMKEKYLEAIFPRTEKQKTSNNRSERWERVLLALSDAEVTPVETRDTLWGLYNAVVWDEDFRTTTEANADRRLERIWFGRGSDLKIRALDQAKKVTKLVA